MYIYIYNIYISIHAHKPLSDDLRASKDKNKRALDGCPCRWPRLRKAAPGQKHPSKPLCAKPMGFAHCLAAWKISEE